MRVRDSCASAISPDVSEPGLFPSPNSVQFRAGRYNVFTSRTFPWARCEITAAQQHIEPSRERPVVVDDDDDDVLAWLV